MDGEGDVKRLVGRVEIVILFTPPLGGLSCCLRRSLLLLLFLFFL